MSTRVVATWLLCVAAIGCKTEQTSTRSKKSTSQNATAPTVIEGQSTNIPGDGEGETSEYFALLADVYNDYESILKTPEKSASCAEIVDEITDFRLGDVLETDEAYTFGCDLLDYEHPAVRSNVRIYGSIDASGPTKNRVIAIDATAPEPIEIVIFGREPSVWYFRLLQGVQNVKNNVANGPPTARNVTKVTYYGPEGSEFKVYFGDSDNNPYDVASTVTEDAAQHLNIETRPLSDICMTGEKLRLAANHMKNKPTDITKILLLGIRRQHGLEKSAKLCSRLSSVNAFGNFGLAAAHADFDGDKSTTRCHLSVGKYQYSQTAANYDPNTPPASPNCVDGINSQILPARAHDTVQNCREEAAKVMNRCMPLHKQWGKKGGTVEFTRGAQIIDQFKFGYVPTTPYCTINLGECPKRPELANRTFLDSIHIKSTDALYTCEQKQVAYERLCNIKGPLNRQNTGDHNAFGEGCKKYNHFQMGEVLTDTEGGCQYREDFVMGPAKTGLFGGWSDMIPFSEVILTRHEFRVAQNSGIPADKVSAITSAVQLENDTFYLAKQLSGKFTFPEAETFCSNLTHRGYNDWRLPTQAEIELGRENRNAFSYGFFWTSDPGTPGSRCESNTQGSFNRGPRTPNCPSTGVPVRCTRPGSGAICAPSFILARINAMNQEPRARALCVRDVTTQQKSGLPDIRVTAWAGDTFATANASTNIDKNDYYRSPWIVGRLDAGKTNTVNLDIDSLGTSDLEIKGAAVFHVDTGSRISFDASAWLGTIPAGKSKRLQLSAVLTSDQEKKDVAFIVLETNIPDREYVTLPIDLFKTRVQDSSYPNPRARSPRFSLRKPDGSPLRDGDTIRVPGFDLNEPSQEATTILSITDQNTASHYHIEAKFPASIPGLRIAKTNYDYQDEDSDFDGVIKAWIHDNTLRRNDFRIPVTLVTNSLEPGLKEISFTLEVGNPPDDRDFSDIEALETSPELHPDDSYGQELVRTYDVSGDGCVSALDALRIINYLGRVDPVEADIPDEYEPIDEDGVRYDVSGDGRVSALDSLQIINFIGRTKYDEGGKRCLSSNSLNR